MDRSEKVHYEETVSEYLEKKQLPEYFELLTRQLVLNQPDDPAQFLIDFLQTRRYARIIFITGIVEDQRRLISSQIANYMNFKEISIDDFFSNQDIQQISDDQINERAYQCIVNNEKHYRGYIISGYPNNFRQATFIQQKGVIAERVYILKNSDNQCRDHYAKFYQNESTIDCALIRDQLNAKDLKQSYDKYYDEFDSQIKKKEEIIDIMKSQLKLKDQRSQPLQSPIVVVVSPPFLRQKPNEIFQLLAEKYGLHCISFDQLVQRQIEQKTEVGKYLQRNLKIKHQVPNDIASTLVRTEVTQPVSKHKGWILEGFPNNTEQIAIFKNYRIKPHLVIIMDDDEDALIQQYQELMIDPLFKQRYEPSANLDDQTTKRLIKDITPKEFYQTILSEYRTFIKEVEMQFESHTQRFRMSKESKAKIMTQIDVFINNPKIYS